MSAGFTSPAAPAFPVDSRVALNGDRAGMSLRDWFAGQALSGLMGSGKFDDDAVGYAYFLADEMLAAREQGK